MSTLYMIIISMAPLTAEKMYVIIMELNSLDLWYHWYVSGFKSHGGDPREDFGA